MRCCQLDPATLPPAEAARPLAPVVERAVELHRQDNTAEAEKLCLEILELAPGQPEALALLYRIRRAGVAERAAETLLRRIVSLYPNTFWATNELTLALLAKGAIAEAEPTPGTPCASLRRATLRGGDGERTRDISDPVWLGADRRGRLLRGRGGCLRKGGKRLLFRPILSRRPPF